MSMNHTGDRNRSQGRPRNTYSEGTSQTLKPEGTKLSIRSSKSDHVKWEESLKLYSLKENCQDQLNAEFDLRTKARQEALATAPRISTKAEVKFRMTNASKNDLKRIKSDLAKEHKEQANKITQLAIEAQEKEIIKANKLKAKIQETLTGSLYTEVNTFCSLYPHSAVYTVLEHIKKTLAHNNVEQRTEAMKKLLNCSYTNDTKFTPADTIGRINQLEKEVLDCTAPPQTPRTTTEKISQVLTAFGHHEDFVTVVHAKQQLLARLEYACRMVGTTLEVKLNEKTVTGNLEAMRPTTDYRGDDASFDEEVTFLFTEALNESTLGASDEESDGDEEEEKATGPVRETRPSFKREPRGETETPFSAILTPDPSNRVSSNSFRSGYRAGAGLFGHTPSVESSLQMPPDAPTFIEPTYTPSKEHLQNAERFRATLAKKISELHLEKASINNKLSALDFHALATNEALRNEAVNMQNRLRQLATTETELNEETESSIRTDQAGDKGTFLARVKELEREHVLQCIMNDRLKRERLATESMMSITATKFETELKRYASKEQVAATVSVNEFEKWGYLSLIKDHLHTVTVPHLAQEFQQLYLVKRRARKESDGDRNRNNPGVHSLSNRGRGGRGGSTRNGSARSNGMSDRVARCYKCQGTGHRARDCTEEERCYLCGKHGDHIQNECPTGPPKKVRKASKKTTPATSDGSGDEEYFEAPTEEEEDDTNCMSDDGTDSTPKSSVAKEKKVHGMRKTLRPIMRCLSLTNKVIVTHSDDSIGYVDSGATGLATISDSNWEKYLTDRKTHHEVLSIAGKGALKITAVGNLTFQYKLQDNSYKTITTEHFIVPGLKSFYFGENVMVRDHHFDVHRRRGTDVADIQDGKGHALACTTEAGFTTICIRPCSLPKTLKAKVYETRDTKAKNLHQRYQAALKAHPRNAPRFVAVSYFHTGSLLNRLTDGCVQVNVKEVLNQYCSKDPDGREIEVDCTYLNGKLEETWGVGSFHLYQSEKECLEAEMRDVLLERNDLAADAKIIRAGQRVLCRGSLFNDKDGNMCDGYYYPGTVVAPWDGQFFVISGIFSSHQPKFLVKFDDEEEPYSIGLHDLTFSKHAAKSMHKTYIKWCESWSDGRPNTDDPITEKEPPRKKESPLVSSQQPPNEKESSPVSQREPVPTLSKPAIIPVPVTPHLEPVGDLPIDYGPSEGSAQWATRGVRPFTSAHSKRHSNRHRKKLVMSWFEAHVFLDHLTGERLRLQAIAANIELIGSPMTTTCEWCFPFKGRATPITHANQLTVPLPNAEWYADYCMVTDPEWTTARWNLTFIDCATHRMYSERTKTRSLEEALPIIKRWHLYFNKTTHPIEWLRFDGEGSLNSSHCIDLLTDLKVRHKTDPRDSPRLRGLIEKMQDEVKIQRKIIMYQASFTTAYLRRFVFWAHKHAEDCVQQAITTGESIYSKYGDTPPARHQKYIFGSLADVKKMTTVIQKEKGTNASRFERLIFVGHQWNAGRPDYRIGRFLNVETGRVISSKDFRVYNGKFDETLRSSTFEGPDEDNSEEEADPLSDASSSEASSANDSTFSDSAPSSHPMREKQEHDESMEEEEEEETSIRRRRRRNKESEPDEEPTTASMAVPRKLSLFLLIAGKANIRVPERYREIALTDEFKSKWWDATDEEIAALRKNTTWEVTELPPGRNVIDSRWCFALKTDSNGEVKRYKARFVAKGFSQKYGEDFEETYAPVVSMTSFRMILSICAVNGWMLKQWDVVTAFLNAKLQEEIYVRQPEGYHVGGPHMVLRMLRALYGLKQAPYLWNKAITKTLRKLGFKKLDIDECVFTATSKDNKVIILALYVDDMIITGDWEEKIKLVEKKLFEKYNMKDVTGENQVLGMHYRYDQSKKEIKLTQRKFIEGILERFVPDDRDIFDTPAETNTYKQVEDLVEGKKGMKTTTFAYRECVGCLQWLAGMTRPDISNIVRFLGKFNNAPNTLTEKFAKRVLGYLRGTMDLGITYSAGATKVMNRLEAYSDASYADDYFTGCSTVGSLVFMNGGPIMWKSQQLKFVADSSTQAEYAAIAETTKSIRYGRKLLDGIFISESEKVHRAHVKITQDEKGEKAVHDLKLMLKEDTSTQLNVDNLAAIHIATTKNGGGRRAKHINVRFMIVREAVRQKEIQLQWVGTKNQIADIFTKCLCAMDFKRLSRALFNVWC